MKRRYLNDAQNGEDGEAAYRNVKPIRNWLAASDDIKDYSGSGPGQHISIHPTIKPTARLGNWRWRIKITSPAINREKSAIKV
jgi:hypothetical protein